MSKYIINDDKSQEKAKKDNSNMNQLKEYWIDILWVLLAIAPTSYALLCDIQISISDLEHKYYWFQRSGSLMVLFAVTLDFEQSKYIHREESISPRIGTNILIGKELSNARRLIQHFAVFLILIGTLIWGYGDLPFKINQQ